MITGREVSGVYQPSSYSAWLILPEGIDRTLFIKKCLLTGSVLVKSVDNEIESNVQVGMDSLHLLKFPTIIGEKGSSVFCVRDPVYRTSKIVAVLQDEDEQQLIFEENQFRIHKRNNSTFVDIDAKGNTGDLDITVNSGANENVESTLNFLNSVNKAKYTIKVQGKYKVVADDTIELQTEKEFKISIQDSDNETSKETIFSYLSGTGLKFKDEFENEIASTKNGVSIKTKNGENVTLDKSGLTIKNSKDDLKKILADTLTELVSAIITTPSGAGSLAPTTILNLQKISARINTLFS